MSRAAVRGVTTTVPDRRAGGTGSTTEDRAGTARHPIYCVHEEELLDFKLE